MISKFDVFTSYLQCRVDNDDKERVGEVKEQPGLNGLDVRSAGEAAGHGEVDGGEDHHAGDVDGDDEVVLVIDGHVVGCLIDDVHQDGRDVGHHEDAGE